MKTYLSVIFAGLFAIQVFSSLSTSDDELRPINTNQILACKDCKK